MKNITVIIPVHKFNKDIDGEYLTNAIKSVDTNQRNTNIKLTTAVVAPSDIIDDLNSFFKEEKIEVKIILNEGKTDFCSQINYAVNKIEDEWFSILEFDDIYTPIWFKSVEKYYYSREDVSIFLPLNVQYEVNEPNIRQYCNEIVWANEFSSELGYIDFECLENFVGFNLTGGVFNKKDFIKMGGLKPSVKVAFNYEYLLRLTHKNLKVFVVPKEGYIHVLNRTNSLTDEYTKTIDDKLVKKWFDVAKTEYIYTEDRGTKPSESTEILK